MIYDVSYGNFNNVKFASDELYDSYEKFENDYQNLGIEQTISLNSLKNLYYLLIGRYGNSTIANSDINQFRFKVFSIIFMYAPTWEKRLSLQKKIRELTDEELMTGDKVVYNNALNPNSQPSTSSLQELNYINSQNTTNNKRSKISAYMAQYNMLETDVTKELLDRFNKLFISIYQPNEPNYYVGGN